MKLDRGAPTRLSAPSWWSLPVRLVRSSQGGLRLSVDWGRLALFLLALALLGWFGLAAAGYLFVKYRRDFDEVRFIDILLPGRWDDYRVARGNFFIERAKSDLKEGNYREAFHHLRVGIATAPANTEGRLLLAQFYAVWGRSDLAQRVLLEGLPHAREDAGFLRSLFGFLLQQQEDAEVRRVAGELLAAAAPGDPRTPLIAVAAATAEYHRGNYDAAEDLLQQHQLGRTKDGRLLQARIEWDRGFRDLALLRLENYTLEFPDDDEFFVQLTAYYRELERWPDVERLAVLRQLRNPRNAAPRIDLLYTYLRTGNRERMEREVDELFREFGGEAPAMLALGDFAANTGDPALARRVFDHCRQRNLGSEGPALMLVEANIVAGRFREALDLVQEFQTGNPEWARRFASVFNGLRAIASYGLGNRDDGDLYLNNFLGQPSLRAENLVAVSGRLLAIGEREPARRVLALATATDPRNQAALSRLIEIDLAAGRVDDLPANLRRLLTLRRPSATLLRTALARLGSDRYLFLAGRDELLDSVAAALEAQRASRAAG